MAANKDIVGLAMENSSFRRVLETGEHCQVVALGRTGCHSTNVRSGASSNNRRSGPDLDRGTSSFVSVSIRTTEPTEAHSPDADSD